MIDLSKVTEVNPFGALNLAGMPHPTLELRTEDRTLDVSAVTAGTVVNRFFNPNEGDFEIHTRAAGSPYLIIYDHIRDPLVDIGSIVSPGTILGKDRFPRLDAGARGDPGQPRAGLPRARFLSGLLRDPGVPPRARRCDSAHRLVRADLLGGDRYTLRTREPEYSLARIA